MYPVSKKRQPEKMPSEAGEAGTKQLLNEHKHEHILDPQLGEMAKNNGKVKYTLDFVVTPHQLRHTYITNLIAAGVDPKTVQYLAGHEKSKITMDVYAKVKYNKPEELAKALTGAFEQWTTPKESQN